MRNALIAVALAAALVLAGCGAGGTPTPSPEPTDTPTPSPTATPTPVEPSAIAGVEDGVVTNGSALQRAHRAALSDVGFELYVSQETTFSANGTTERQRSESTLRAEASLTEATQRTVTENTVAERTGSREVWANGSQALARVQTESPGGSETSFQYARSPTAASTGGVAGAVFQLGTFEVNGTDVVDGERRVSLTLAELNESALQNQDIDVQSASGSAVVDAEGRVRSLSFRLEYTQSTALGENTSVVVSVRQELREVGDVDVEQPAWVDDARANLSFYDVDATLVDGQYLRVTNDGPDAIPADHQVGLGGVGEFRPQPGEIGREVAPGETVWAYVPEDGYRVQVTDERPDAAGREANGSVTVRLQLGFQQVVTTATAGEDDGE
jgi:hypothetical protein